MIISVDGAHRLLIKRKNVLKNLCIKASDDNDQMVQILDTCSTFKLDLEQMKLFQLDEDEQDKWLWLNYSELVRLMTNAMTLLVDLHLSTLEVATKIQVLSATDVQCKAVAPRKAGKEGPVADCIACLVTSVLYGIRLRTTVETQAQNCASVLAQLPAAEAIKNQVLIHNNWDAVNCSLELLQQAL